MNLLEYRYEKAKLALARAISVRDNLIKNLTKNEVLMRDVIIKYHPEFRKSASLREQGMKHPDMFNIEYLVEQSLAAVGPYEFVDEAGYDFTDFSDSKTVTVNAKTGNTCIRSVEAKIGALRIVAFNAITGETDYFFVPKNEVKKIKKPSSGKKSVGKEKIEFTYSTYSVGYGKFDQYRVSTFKDLALR